MNAYAPRGYAAINTVETDPRRAEASILSNLAARMMRATEVGPAAFPALVAAVHDNRRFWQIAAEDLAGDGNKLPDQLRAQLLSLAIFVERETTHVLSGRRPADALIEIDRAVARGLFDQAAA